MKTAWGAFQGSGGKNVLASGFGLKISKKYQKKRASKITKKAGKNGGKNGDQCLEFQFQFWFLVQQNGFC